MKDMRLTDAETGGTLSNFQSFTKGGLITALKRALNWRCSSTVHTFQHLPFACADFKRQRLPALFRPLHPFTK
jgi:hypothetical protein